MNNVDGELFMRLHGKVSRIYKLGFASTARERVGQRECISWPMDSSGICMQCEFLEEGVSSQRTRNVIGFSNPSGVVGGFISPGHAMVSGVA